MASPGSALARRGATPVRWLPAALLGGGSRSSQATVTVRALLVLVAGIVLFVATIRWPGWVPVAAFAPVVVLAGLYLTPTWLVIVSVTFVLELVISSSIRGWDPAQVVGLVSIVVVMVIMTTTSRSRARLGVQGNRGESMFVDLRDGLKAFGELPVLPPGWHAESAVESAYGQSFSGDFVVATRSHGDSLLEVALVDVSGKGVEAGTRALLLSGALGGLLGEQDPERLLGAANSYLLRQRWEEGFATAVHVSIDLASGDYTIGNAGHPPAVQFVNGSGRWEVLGEAAGPLLGVIDGADYPRSSRRLGRGDALVLYTDGIVESRYRDLTTGVDRMLGAAERLVRHGFAGGATRLCAAARAGESDDRAVVMIWRD